MSGIARSCTYGIPPLLPDLDGPPQLDEFAVLNALGPKGHNLRRPLLKSPPSLLRFADSLARSPIHSLALSSRKAYDYFPLAQPGWPEEKENESIWLFLLHLQISILRNEQSDHICDLAHPVAHNPQAIAAAAVDCTAL